MKKCPACKNKINIRANKCHYCGEIQETNQTKYFRKKESERKFFDSIFGSFFDVISKTLLVVAVLVGIIFFLFV